jgi:hypothetical protein
MFKDATSNPISFRIRMHLRFRDFNQAIFELTMVVDASTFLKTIEPVVFCLLSLAFNILFSLAHSLGPPRT